nr:putative F-box protein At1g12855 [Oryza sativa Japonica Group]
MDVIATKNNKKAIDRNPQEPTTTLIKTYKRRKRRRVQHHCHPGASSLPNELVYEILLRLPVKTLSRSKSVCRAWRATISNPSFITTHLKQQQQSAVSRHEQKPSFLITPHTLDSMIDDEEPWPTTFSNIITFYRWQETEQDDAHLVRATNLHGEFRSVYGMSHYDGLVIFPTNTRLYVFNPATGDVLKLPDGQKSRFQTAGLGLDLGTNTYKIVRSFDRSIDFNQWAHDAAGMEVFTIGNRDSCWRTIAEDPPYPVTADPMYFKGSLYWHICKELLQEGSPPPPQGFLRFDLQDETFGLVLHDVVSPSDETRLDLVELGGELCLAQYLGTEMVIWKSSPSPSDDISHQWDRLYTIGNLPDEGVEFQTVLRLR